MICNDTPEARWIVAGTLALAEPRDACSTVRLQRLPAGVDAAAAEVAAAGQQDMIALLERGGCSFVQKASPDARVLMGSDAPPADAPVDARVYAPGTH